MRNSGDKSREKLIIAAIDEMQKHGIADFSLRRVAQSCGVSSGAPYKHFRNKNELILEAIRYINGKWGEMQKEVVASCNKNPRTRLVETSIAYIKFLCQNPAFQSVIMLSDNSMLPEQLEEKAKTSKLTSELIEQYCKQVGMSEKDKRRKTYAVRSFIFGAAFMINSGIFPNNEETLETVKQCIEREFDID